MRVSRETVTQGNSTQIILTGENMKSSFFVLFILTLLVLSNSGFGQSFQITHILTQNFSLDKFANEVYFTQYGPYNIFVKNLKDSTIKVCPFPSIPVFGNRSRKCVYGDGDSIFVFDFETMEKTKIGETAGPYGALAYEFSPNDKYVLFKDHYYSFMDSTLHQIDFSPDPFLNIQWMTETKFVWAFDNEQILSFDLLNNSIDTVLTFAPNLPFTTYSFNRKTNLLYYSLSQPEYPKIHSFNSTTHSDSIIIDTEDDTTDNCWWTYNDFREMKWSPDSSRMAFFSYILDGGGTIYTYNPADKRLFKYTNCGGEGYEENLKWLNNDTIVYLNITLRYVYGMALDDPLAVDEPEGSQVPVTMELSQNYPNPFNPATTINYQLPQAGFVSLKVYDVLGREVAVLVREEKTAGRYTVNFEAPNLASGIYIYQLRVNNYITSRKMLLLR